MQEQKNAKEEPVGVVATINETNLETVDSVDSMALVPFKNSEMDMQVVPFVEP